MRNLTAAVRMFVLAAMLFAIGGIVLAQGVQIPTQITAMPISGNLGERELVHPEALHFGNQKFDTVRFGPADRRSCMGNCNNPGDGVQTRVDFGQASLFIAQFSIQTPVEVHPRGSNINANLRSIVFSNGLPVLNGEISVGQLHVSDSTAPNGRVEFDNVRNYVERKLGNGLTVRLNEVELVTANWARFHSIHIFSTDGTHTVDFSIGLFDFASGACTPCPVGSQCFAQADPDWFNRLVFTPTSSESVNYRLKLSTGQTLFGTAWKQVIPGDDRARFVDISNNGGVGFQIAVGGQQINLSHGTRLVMTAAPSCQ